MSFTENALYIMKKLYFRKDKAGNLVEKTPEELFARVADFVAEAETDPAKKKEFRKQIYHHMLDKKFMFSSPTLFNAGGDFPLASSCFVGKLEDDMSSIMKAATDTAITFKAGAGMGLNFGMLRPKGASVGQGGTSSGPVSFMHLFNEVGETVKSGGVRRAAFMAMMDINHPDVEAFITSKDFIAQIRGENPGADIPDHFVDLTMGEVSASLSTYLNNNDYVSNLTGNIRKTLFEPLSNMNISVAVSDRFMKCVADDTDFELDRHKDKGVTRTVVARELFHKIALSAWRTADPGVWFIDRANQYDTVPSFGRIDSTNPCGEQSLHHYTSCNLGSINLVPFMKDGSFDYDSYAETIAIATRALDNVIDMAAFPTEDFTRNTRMIRPIGLGYTGLGEVLFMLGIPYNSEEGCEFAANLARIMTQTSIRTSIELGHEKGSFEIYETNREALIKVAVSFFDDDDEKAEIEDLIRRNGIRNSNWTTLAPTGSISLILDSYTYSLEPQFALAYHKNLVDGGVLTYVDPAFEQALGQDKELIEKVAQNGGSCADVPGIPDKIKRVFTVAHDINYLDRIKMQSAIQRYVSNSISSTINLPTEVTVEEIEEIYRQAWEMNLKGITIYRDGCKSFQPMTTTKKKKEDAPKPDLVCRAPYKRPNLLKGEIVKTKTGSGTLYTSIGLDENFTPIEIFINISKHGSETSSFAEALGRVISIGLQNGVPSDRIADSIIGIVGDKPTWDNGKLIKSIPDAVGRVLRLYSEQAKSEAHGETTLFDKGATEAVSNEIDYKNPVEIPGATACPSCGEMALVRTEDCMSCLSCGYSKCG
ncbi:MAG: ribonucleoside-diphosphate reductase, adenosylcobalamin-dependent [Spirochaetes bacterium GWF1_51_8]|nr:MAG: ribonucleoside-diphosphate reductase, adenosylcobalamin-dependent [Spirochaetes bacterium GWF1_51_8]